MGYLDQKHTHIDKETVDKADQTKEYRRLIRKFWFAAAVSLPVLLSMLVEIVPSFHDITAPWHRLIGILSALITLPVLIWSGGQFFIGAWNNLRNHNTNMDILVALGTGTAWLYSTTVH
ncbi:MAG: hypothetical protein AB1489_23960 [Acidobacteriota bacterium]